MCFHGNSMFFLKLKKKKACQMKVRTDVAWKYKCATHFLFDNVRTGALPLLCTAYYMYVKTGAKRCLVGRDLGVSITFKLW